MLTAQQLRTQIETQLANKIPSALTPRPCVVRENILTGICEIDELTSGGFPLGAITELIGAPSSGRTTVAMSLVANASCAGNVCAWIDAGNEFDVSSADAMGIVLPQLLLVRCGVRSEVIKARSTTTTNKLVVEQCQAASGATTGHGSPHPRNEIRGLGQAVGELFQFSTKGHGIKPGSPSAPNTRFCKVGRDEQVASDRLPARREPGVCFPKNPDDLRMSKNTTTVAAEVSPYIAIEEAIRVMDLLMQHGGFHVVVMNLSNFSPALVQRVPLATWFRFRSLAELHHSCFVLLVQYSCAKSSAAVSLKMNSIAIVKEGPVMTGLTYTAAILRQRFQDKGRSVLPLHKPPQRVTSADWKTKAVWAIP